MRYRKEVDGLRALAVIPVVLFHAGFAPFSGGFIGVDVFFVISGFLITSIIITEKEAGTFSLLNFYERRVRRILPALFFVMLCCFPFAWAWMFPTQLKDFSQSLVAVSVFVSNILFWRESGYFAHAAQEKPLLHTWSLAVEEQYYVIFPLFIVLFWSLGKRRLISLTLMAAILSLGLSEWELRNISTTTFYSAHTRAWEILTGAICAFYLLQKKDQKGNQWLSLFGIGLIIYAVFEFDGNTPFPSLYTLIPVLGTALIILFGTKKTIISRILSIPFIVKMGLISYSFYLWHYPLFAFARIRSLNTTSNTQILFLIALSIALAWVTWRYIERPFRSKQNKLFMSRKKLFASVIGVSVFFISIGLTGHYSNGFENRLNDQVRSILSSKDDKNPRVKECFDSKVLITKDVVPCIYGSAKQVKIALLGDSHADSIVWELGQALDKRGLGLVQLNYRGCIPLLGFYQVGRPGSRCQEFNEAVLEFLNSSSVDTLVLLARWTLYLEKEPFNNLEGGMEGSLNVYVDVVGHVSNGDEKNRKTRVTARYIEGIKELLSRGKKIVLVYPIPEAGWNVPEYLAKAAMYGEGFGGMLSTSYDQFNNRNSLIHLTLDNIEHPNLVRVKIADTLCNSYVKGRCINQLKGVPLYYDEDHLSNAGAKLVVESIVNAIQNTH